MSNARHWSQAGFSLVELLVATGVLLVITSVVSSGLLQMTRVQGSVANRTDMHSGIRSATELLQQEVGQAGRISVPAKISLAAPVNAGDTTARLTSVEGLFPGALLSIESGGDPSLNFKVETVQITFINDGTNEITVKHVSPKGVQIDKFQYNHANGAAVTPGGGFGTGVVPPAPPLGEFENGSTGDILKLYGDVNGDGKMVYVEYVCDTTNDFALYRNMMDWDSEHKPPLTPASILLTNIRPNPPQTAGGDNVPCFQYQMDASGSYVLDVAITLTVETRQVDPITRKPQRATKALLNVSPRNVIGAWQSAGLDAVNVNRVQPMPGNIKNNLLLPSAP
jgi:prepilin-type N-terminal cleavage/methylation domain-containing protein